MNRRNLVLTCCLLVTAINTIASEVALAQPPPDAAAESGASSSMPGKPQGLVKRRTSPTEVGAVLDAARRQARSSGKPLFVHVGATWCEPCERLKAELEIKAVQGELARWTYLYLDSDESPADARHLAVTGIPALRLIDGVGKVVGSREGFLKADALVTWLADNYESAKRAPAILALETKPLEEADLANLIKLLDVADPLEREAAIRRLVSAPKVAAGPVTQVLLEGRLAARLSALEVLAQWDAPVAGLDPWTSETFSAERLQAVMNWSREVTDNAAPTTSELTAEERIALSDELSRLEGMSSFGAEALIERLAHYGKGLRPMVVEQLNLATSDRARQRLTWLRYRLATSDALVRGWPGGLESLSAIDRQVRQSAVSQLVDRASSDDQELLLELFGDPDPLVRELTLQALHRVGAQGSSGALIKLLNDPEPNVRAAVLKQLAEVSDPVTAATVSEYLLKETDADLVVHGIRVLKAAKKPGCLTQLLQHSSWQVRAAAAEALGELASQLKAGRVVGEIDEALVAALNEQDSFVLSRVIRALKFSDLSTVAPLAKAAEQHPEVAFEVVDLLLNSGMRSKAESVLRKYATSDDPQIRAKVIAELVKVDAENVEQLVQDGLEDSNSRVRESTAKSLLKICDEILNANPDDPFSIASGNQLIKERPAPGSPAVGATHSTKDKDDESETAAPASVATDGASSDEDQDLIAFRRGRRRPNWMVNTIAPLLEMLGAKSPTERLAAACALLPLGQDEQALPVLREIVAHEPKLLGEVSDALPWLLIEDRTMLFDSILAQKPNGKTMGRLSQKWMSRGGDTAAKKLWQLLEPADLPSSDASTIGEALLHPNRHMATDRLGKREQRELVDYIKNGSHWQQNLALARLLGARETEEDVVELAQVLFDDPTRGVAQRASAFQLLLLASTEKAGKRLAVRQFNSDNERVRKLALQYLVQGANSVVNLQDSLHIYRPFLRTSYDSTGVPEAPLGIKEEDLRPLLASPDAEVAAAAAYVLALLGSSEGLPAVERIWRSQNKNNRWNVPLYQAIAALDDEKYAPLLAEINSKLGEWEKRDFYWTIRELTGPEIVKLRKEIRDEVGMDRLR